MTDETATADLDLLPSPEAAPKPRRRKAPPRQPALALSTAPSPAPAPPAPMPPAPEPVGGFMGLWNSVTGRAQGAPAGGDTGLTLAFLICIVTGTALCFVGALDVPFARQTGFAGPLLATLAYPLWGAATGAAGRPSLRERLADNAYYLGFIFTQIALLVGFLPAAFGTAELSADQIIRFFGVALGASLIGLVARTVLIQMSYSVDEAADIVSGEVSVVAREVSRQCSAVLTEFDALVERLRTSQNALTTDLQTGMATLTATVAAYDQALKTDAATLHEGVQLASSATDRISAGVDSGRARLTDSIDGIARVIDQLRASLQTQMEEASSSIAATTQVVQRGVSSMQAVHAVQDGVGLVDEKLGALSGRLETVDAMLARSAGSLDESLRALDDQIERTGQRGLERAETINTNANEVAAALEKTLTGFRTELERLRG